MLFSFSTLELTAFVLVIVVGGTLAGSALGRYLREHDDGLREPLGVVQGALVGFVGLILAFGLSMAVGRYESRRTAVVDEANAIGTTYLRAQTLAEPVRTESMDLLKKYTDARIALSDSVPDSDKFRRSAARSEVMHRDLWGLAGDAVNAAPTSTAPRLYLESLNEMIDAHRTRLAALANRIPDAVMFLQLIISALAFGVLALYLALLGKAVIPAVVGALMVSAVLLITADLDRPHRGFIIVPDAPLVATRAEMIPPPTAVAPTPPQP